jgi:hypothetical protein
LKALVRAINALWKPAPAWDLSPYPDGKAFGFTIVHDADSAYSQRLAPIMDAFDEIGLKITVTVFPLWAAWALDPVRIWSNWRSADPFFAPFAVPLEDPDECRFYLELQRRGHEIAMHTPSETSSLRGDVTRAFELFQSVFGASPRVYVEHSPDNNLDAQRRHGSDPGSVYYNTDLLNQSGCWVWVCDPETDFPRTRGRRFNVLSDDQGPFCPRARERFGIMRAFLRSPTFPSDGDGFLATFTKDVFDALEQQRGLALVYTHLAKGWLDPATRRLRTDIADRLRVLAARNVWFAPAATILDRFAALRQVELKSSRTMVELISRSDASLSGLTITPPPGFSLSMAGGGALPRLPNGLVVIGELAPRMTRRFQIVPI